MFWRVKDLIDSVLEVSFTFITMKIIEIRFHPFEKEKLAHCLRSCQCSSVRFDVLLRPLSVGCFDYERFMFADSGVL